MIRSIIRPIAPSIASIGPAGTQALSSARPPGRKTRSIFRSDCAGSAAKITPNADRTASAPPLSTGSASKSPSRKSISSPCACARSRRPRAAAGGALHNRLRYRLQLRGGGFIPTCSPGRPSARSVRRPAPSSNSDTPLRLLLGLRASAKEPPRRQATGIGALMFSWRRSLYDEGMSDFWFSGLRARRWPRRRAGRPRPETRRLSCRLG